MPEPSSSQPPSSAETAPSPPQPAPGDLYERIDRAERFLEEVGPDPQVLSFLVAAYSKLGLTAISLETARRLPAELHDQPAFAEAMAALRNAPGGKLTFRSRRRTFEANLAALRDAPEVVSAVRSSWETEGALLELFRCADGNFQARLAPAEGAAAWMCGLRNHIAAETGSSVIPARNGQLHRPFLLSGLGFGWMLEPLHKATANIFLGYSSALYLVEPDSFWLAALLHLHDWTQLLSDPRVHVWTGAAALQHLRDALTENEQWALPGAVYRFTLSGRYPGPDVQDAMDEIRGAYGELRSRLEAEVNAVYAGVNDQTLARRLAGDTTDGPLRVLCLSSRHTTFIQFAIRDVKAALERKGYDVRILDEESDHTHPVETTYLRLIRDFRPDLIFVIDNLRRGFPSSIPRQIPWISWVQDRLDRLFCKEAGRSLRAPDAVDDAETASHNATRP